MGEVIKLLANIINELHDNLVILLQLLGLSLTDKELHFWIFGVFGIAFFFSVDVVFKWIAKWSITALSFIYTITFLIIMVLAIEIQQKITGRGNMEFNDAVASILGFLAIFGVYVIIRVLVYFGMKFYRKSMGNKKESS